MTNLAAALDETRRLQGRAADPAACAWVAANAGTGKTHVLSRRVLRVLLAGAAPERILCLTYTKAAAAEMANRVFAALARWVTLPDGELTAALNDLLGRAPAPDESARARTLFARAIETPGGLKVQTIHAFCERLLQRFPLEAGVPPGFKILDDADGRTLQRAAIDAVLHDATREPDGVLGQALRQVVAYAAEERFDTVLGEALRERHWIEQIFRVGLGEGDDPYEAAERLYREALGVRRGVSRHHIDKELGAVLDDDVLERLHNALRRGTKTDQQCATRVAAALAASHLSARIDELTEYFCTTRGDPRAKLMTQGVENADAALASLVAQAQFRFIELLRERAAHDCMAATLALLRLADAAMQHFAEAKRRRASLDFDDLIERTANLLHLTDWTQWVLYKLDGGLDHILVDESQDTSPLQWDVIKPLANEFVSGEGARTLFAVGDEKQSIYGFQGAAPEMFAKMGVHFAQLARGARRVWHDVPLTLSFRSTAPVLEAVDRVFADPNTTQGVSAPTAHVPRRSGQAGLIEIWPTETHDAKSAADAWSPLAETSSRLPAVRLADRIAATIQGWLGSGERLESEGRPVRAGDILILVRKRGVFAGAMVAALKKRGITVAGADRMALLEQISVADLVALGDFLTLPEDDLALAAVLKSPMFGLDDDALLNIAAGRRGTLWSALLRATNSDERYREAGELLARWRKRADFKPPYEFFAGILDRDGMRRRLLGRLGPDAADPIDEFLELALAYDERAAPSLPGFLGWLRSTRPEIKRDMDQGRDEVRVMTVHGAKGLEAPIVFLPDTCSKSDARSSLVRLAGAAVPLAHELFVWPVKGTSRVVAVETARAAQGQHEDRERDRLLYVAMTRARDRLYVAGFEGQTGRQPGCWYDLVWTRLQNTLTEIRRSDGTTIWRNAAPQLEAPDNQAKQAHSAAGAPAVLPEWATRSAPREREAGAVAAPSRFAPYEKPAGALRRVSPNLPDGGQAGPETSTEDQRLLRGTLTHLLLQHLPALPPQEWPTAAEALLARRGAVLPLETLASIAAEALGVLSHPDYAVLFGPESRAEVPIVAAVPHPADGYRRALRIVGQVDRLARVGREVRIVDYKTNRPAPRELAEVPEAYILQLAAYRLALQHVFAGETVFAAILWTDGPRLMEIPAALLESAIPRLWEQAASSP